MNILHSEEKNYKIYLQNRDILGVGDICVCSSRPQLRVEGLRLGLNAEIRRLG